MAEKDLKALFVHQLKDTYFAENAILKALPQMAEAAQSDELRIRGGITASILLFVPSPSHGLISLVPWEPTASVADLETAAVNSPRILRDTEA